MRIPTKHLPAEERRAVTVEAVIALAAVKNPNDITTADIAKQMHVTQGSLFRHFPTKDAIWQSVMEWVAERLMSRIDSAARGVDSPMQALHAMFKTHVDFVIDHPGVPRMMFGQLQNAASTPAKRLAQTLIQRYSERISGLLEQGKANGEITADVDTRAAAILFVGMLQGLVMQSLLSGDIARMRQDEPGVFAVFARGLRGQP
ncbi:MAG: TetR/AcrR family transcriptional regulator [Betaproteobacteria bacterium]